jgi:hypothetical protein
MPAPDDLIAMLIFSIVGFLAFKHGRRELQLPKIVIGLVLMIYPYFIPSGLWLWVTGAALTGLLYFFRE